MTKSVEGEDHARIAVQAQSDPSAFEKIVVNYQQKLFHYVLKYIQDEDIAQDIVQDAFIKMYTYLNSYDPKRPFSAWAYRITHNEMVNHLRKQKPSTELNEEAQYSDMFDDRPDFLEEIDKRMEASHVQSLLKKLPMKYREVLILHYFQHCDYETISSIISRPTATVGTRLRRAKDQLKQLYLKEYGNEA